jgi:protein phosphatase
MPPRFAAATDPGLRRTLNEDVALARELPAGGVLLAVADGAGGMGGGDIASAETIAAVIEVCGSFEAAAPAETLREAVARANTRVRERAASESRLAAMASTLVAAIIRDGTAWVASIGDSRAYLFANSQLEQLTEDDSWVAEQVRSGRMAAEQAARSPHRNIITRAIGAQEEALVAPTEHVLAAGDVLLLCSDGLHGVVDDAAIAAVLAGAEPDAAAAALIALANRAGGPDNIAVAVYRA